LSAARIVAEVGDPARFATPAALAAYVGAVPALKQSGKRKPGRAGLTPIGHVRLRTALWMPVLTAVRSNAWLRAFYECLIARGKPAKLALVAASSCTPSTALPATAARSSRWGDPARSAATGRRPLARPWPARVWPLKAAAARSAGRANAGLDRSDPCWQQKPLAPPHDISRAVPWSSRQGPPRALRPQYQLQR
jgi:hypothetical protein